MPRISTIGRPCGAVALLAVAAATQNVAVVPAVCADLPGNAAVSLPLRWSHGTMQVFVDPPMLPTNFVGQTLTGLWLRRPTLPGDGAYGAITRTLTVRGAFQQPIAASMFGTLTQNRPANTAVLFGPAPVTSAAVAAPGAGTTVGADLLHIVFTQPLPVTAGTLFLEFETGDAPLQVSADHWVDAIWNQGGVEAGMVAAVGDGSCTTRSEPTRLAWTATGEPAAGATATFGVSGLPPTFASSTGWAFVWVGVDPVARAAGPGYLGFGGDLGILDPGLAGCRQWAPFDLAWGGLSDAFGRYTTSFAVPGAAVLGTRLGVQAGWLDPARPGLPLSVSNGLTLVLGSIGVNYRCNTLMFPAGTTTSPWTTFVGMMPVLRLEY